MQELTFETAYKRLKEINELLKSQQFIDIDQIIKLQEEAKGLYEFCEGKLKNLDNN